MGHVDIVYKHLSQLKTDEMPQNQWIGAATGLSTAQSCVARANLIQGGKVVVDRQTNKFTLPRVYVKVKRETCATKYYRLMDVANNGFNVAMGVA